MLIVKGQKCSFDMKDGGSVTGAGAMMHDSTGRYWSKCSLLFGTFQRGNRRVPDSEMKGAPRNYLGRTHQGNYGSVNLPPKALSEWEHVGEVKEIWYTRTGKKAPFRFRHPFGKKSTVLSFFKGVGHAQLYKCGRFYRLQLGKNCILDDRGICWP